MFLLNYLIDQKIIQANFRRYKWQLNINLIIRVNKLMKD